LSWKKQHWLNAHTTDNSAFIASQENNSLNSTPTRANRSNNNTSSRGGSSNHGGGRNRGRGSGRGGRSHNYPQGSWNQPWACPSWASQWQPWATPPCPYPTAGNWQQPVTPNRQPGILGQLPQQVHVASAQLSYMPTDIQVAMHTMSMAPPDEQWYMDTRATSHMTTNRGNLTSYSNISNHIIVGSGHNIPVIGHGNALLPNSHTALTLNHVLHAPKLIKNLVSVQKFTIDNEVSVEFDPFGFSVKDLQTGMLLMRCNSSGELYPLTPKSTHQSPTPSTFVTLSNNLLHNRLGHPGAAVLNSLHRNKFIFCNKSQNNHVCPSCL